VAMALPFWIFRKYEKALIRRKTKSRDICRILYPAGLYLFDLWNSRYGSKSRQARWAEALYVHEVPGEQMRLRGAKRVVRLWLCLMTAVIVGICLSAGGKGNTREIVEFLPRPELGETELYEMEVTGVDEMPLEINVKVNGVQPADEELQMVFDRAFSHVTEDILGDNLSTEEIHSDLNLVSVTDYGIRIQWESMHPELINSRGQIVAEQIADEGEIVVLRAALSYGTYQAFYDLPLRLLPREKDAAYYYQLLLSEIDDRNNADRSTDKLELPKNLDGREIRFFRHQMGQPWGVIVLIIIAGVLLVVSDCQNMKTEYENRNQQLLRDYPSLLFKLSIMVGCGITLRSSWARIIDGYQKQKEKTDLRYVYEEMILTQRRINAGDNEATAYLMFGQRCGTDCYLRLGTYLNQNLRQGVSGMQGMLESEMNYALEDRRNLMLRLGEAMNTRLLLPMVLMLGVVIAVLMAPAMLSM